MQFLLDNYIIIIIISTFILFSLIGYLIDTYRNTKDKIDENMLETNQIEIEEIKDTTLDNDNYKFAGKEEKQDKEETKKDKGDDLLNNYDNI